MEIEDLFLVPTLRVQVLVSQGRKRRSPLSVRRPPKRAPKNGDWRFQRAVVRSGARSFALGSEEERSELSTMLFLSTLNTQHSTLHRSHAREAELARRSRTGIAKRYWPPKATGDSRLLVSEANSRQRSFSKLSTLHSPLIFCPRSGTGTTQSYWRHEKSRG